MSIKKLHLLFKSKQLVIKFFFSPFPRTYFGKIEINSLFYYTLPMEKIEERIALVEELFTQSTNREEVYKRLMELGKTLPSLQEQKKTANNRIPGCQSITHLSVTLQKGRCIIEGDSDALISKGLVYLVISIYSGLSPKEILLHKPTFLNDYISAALSMNRSEGLGQMLLFLKRKAVEALQKESI